MLGGGLLRKIGRKVLGRVVETVRERRGPLGAGAGRTEKVTGWQPPGWLRAIFWLLEAILKGIGR